MMGIPGLSGGSLLTQGGRDFWKNTMQPGGATAYNQGMQNQAQSAAELAMRGPGKGGNWFTGPITADPGSLAKPFMNPFMSNVVDATRSEFDNMRGMASMDANQQATMAGAFGGSRHGVMEGTRLGEIDRAQGSTIGNLLNGGYQNAMGQGLGWAQYNQGLQQQQQMEPIWRQQMAQGFYQGGQNPNQQPGTNRMGAMMGGAMAGAPFGPWGALAGGGLGLLGSFL